MESTANSTPHRIKLIDDSDVVMSGIYVHKFNFVQICSVGTSREMGEI